MSVDRFGVQIKIGWAAHEILWLEAALTLPLEERYDAFRDIAAMSGRTFEAIRGQAYWRAHQRRKHEAIEAKITAELRRRSKPQEPLDRKLIAWPTPEQRMVGRATYSPTTGMRT